MRKPVIIRCKFMPKGVCLNLFGTFWARDTRWIDAYVVNHERIHTAQQQELLWVPFYLLYVLEWAVRLLQYRNAHKAYMNISFEREAYRHGHDLHYLPRRKRYAWIAHIKRPQ
ncbi:MAG: hypothetical protein J1F06_07795 [Prevotellaceae bacterium]|nr:hypothetical protein [Prevotellaceae bacterium]